MSTNFSKVYAMKKQARDKLHKVLPALDTRPGIYLLTRDDESGLKFTYVGQAINLEDRLVQHLTGYKQRIDRSLRKRGFYDEVKRPYGWKLAIIHCDPMHLDALEKEMIMRGAEKGYQLYNKTAGGQGEGKVGIDDGASPKGYRDGIKQGYKNCHKEVKEYFDKYLTFDIKEPKYTKKGGVFAIKQEKYDAFKEWLEEEQK